MSIKQFGKHLASRIILESGEPPQFKSDHLSTLQEMLDDKGVLYTVERVPVNELGVARTKDLDKSTVEEKIEEIENEGKVRPAIVSKEYKIIDGRHGARAIGEVKGKDHKAPVFRIHLPTEEATGMLKDAERQINEQKEDMDIVAVFSGRFQPFHRGHYKVYEHLSDRFGRNNTYIGTSGKVDPPRSPFTFRQKKKIITGLFDVPHENVVEVKSPYAPEEILDQYDPDSTAYVAAVSEKDKGRLLGGGYFSEYPPEDEFEGYEEAGYVYTTPMAGFTFRGQEISGTRVREAFRSGDIPEEEKKEFFRYIYGTFNQKIYDLMTKRLSEARYVPSNLIREFIGWGGLKKAERHVRRKQALNELSTGRGAPVDDGPSTWYSDLEDYQETAEELARLFGFEVLDYIADRIDDEFKEDGLPFDSFYPTGIGPKAAVDGDISDVYESFAEATAEAAGFELLSWMGAMDEEKIRSLYHNSDENIAMALGEPETAQDIEDEAEKLEGEEDEAIGREEETEGENPENKAGTDEDIESVNEIIESVKKDLLNKKQNGHMVECKECGNLYGQINHAHTSHKHDMSLDEYEEKHPNAPLISENARKKMRENNAMNDAKNRRKVSEALSGRTRKWMRGDKNPAKKDEVRKEISKGVEESYENNPELRELRAKTFGKSTYSDEYREEMYESGNWLRPEEKDDYLEYKEKVRRYTERQLRKHEEKFDLEKRARNGHHVDHEYSKQSGFLNDIPPEVVSHYSNLRLIPHSVNESKGAKNSKTKKQLIKDVTKNKNGRKLLQAGGSAGHMNHPFEDLQLTFGDLKNMINLAFDGNLDIEEQPVEKVDGQNLMVSWKNGDLVAARNKGHLKNFGEGAMDLRDLVQKFEGRGAIREAFEYAFRDLSIALSEVRDERLEEIFEEGKKWMSLEVIYPAAKNVVDYGDSFIVFHGVIEHDENGNAIDFKKDAAYRLAEVVEEVDQKVQDEFEILSPPEVDLPNIQLEDLREELIGEVESYMNEYGMSNDNKVLDWHEEWWEEFIREKAGEFDYDIPEHVVAGLIKRWAWGNKSGEDGYGLRTFKSEVDNEDFKDWADSFDKNDYKNQFKENMKPIEEVFLRLGTEVLKRAETVLATDPEKTEQDIQSQIQDVRAQLEGAADEEKIQKLRKQMSRLEKAGGIDNIALEGIVFQYDGTTYKLTGAWSAANQVIGIMKYGR